MILDPQTGTVSYSHDEMKSIQYLLQVIRDRAMTASRFDEVEEIKDLAGKLGLKIRVSKDVDRRLG